MENSSVVDALEAAEHSFEQAPQNVEEGLDVADAELVQLRRACRLLPAASRLLDRVLDGRHRVVVCHYRANDSVPAHS
jgi:HPt (histidine-containing phosphotransfer) domain-containing protein